MAANHPDLCGGPGRDGDFLSLSNLHRHLGFDAARLPRSLFLMLENLLVRSADEPDVARAFREWLEGRTPSAEVPFRPNRILMQDTAGVAALADIAALMDKLDTGAVGAFQLAVPVDLVIDHSVNVDFSGGNSAPEQNLRREFERNGERYSFFKWAQNAFKGLTIIPPGNGICHQINLERLTSICITDPVHGLVTGECVVGTDSHTTMVNALGVLAWGLGGIEAEAVALGEPLMMQLPPVTAVRLTGRRPAGTTATDICLAITQRLRAHGVVGHFVEFRGEGLDDLSLADRASIANMAPEYGATCGLFPVDGHTLDYLRLFGKSPSHVALVERYARATGLWRDDHDNRTYTDTIEFHLGDAYPAMAGPKRPQDRVALHDVPASFGVGGPGTEGDDFQACGDGSIAVAAITSCTNTANLHLLLTAGLVARKARQRGLMPPAWVKTSMAPGSVAIAGLVAASGLQDDLDALGFNIVGYGCTTCVGNSGELLPEATAALASGANLCAVLSGNRNFEGRIHPDLKSAYLASPPLVVATALAGNIRIDLTSEPVGTDSDGKPVYLSDLWPSPADVDEIYDSVLRARAGNLDGRDWIVEPEGWTSIAEPVSSLYPWSDASNFLRRPPFFDAAERDCLADIGNGRALLVLGDSVTTDHISPIGRIGHGSSAALELLARGVEQKDFGTYGERRANHEVMVRGTFAHSRLSNLLAGGRVGALTMIQGVSELLPVYDAAATLRSLDRPAIVFAGHNYGTGSARDWAAKGTLLLGVRAVVANSFERIHRTNLAAVGVLPLAISEPPEELAISPSTIISVEGLGLVTAPGAHVTLVLTQEDGRRRVIEALCRVDTMTEIQQMRRGGLFASLLRGVSA